VPRVVPERLYFSRLPRGELEFSCVVVLPATTPQDASISWTLRPADGGRRSRAGEQPVEPDEIAQGWAILSASLPSGWPASVLTLEVGGDTSAHDVRRFRQEQRFRLPLGSDALVAVGHRIGEPHRVAYGLPSQQFAWDLLPLRPGDLAMLNAGVSQPTRSADLAGYGQDVLSPAAGVVAVVVDGIPDAELLGQQQPALDMDLLEWAAGNRVIIRHDGQVHSCLAHLQPGSITVAVGQQVIEGERVGAVGSSGNVTGPHLHLQFMDGADLVSATPLPVELTAEGETIAPTSGQIIGP
jgi:Peptidase family M23